MLVLDAQASDINPLIKALKFCTTSDTIGTEAILNKTLMDAIH